MGSYKKIGLSHEMGLIDTPPLTFKLKRLFQNSTMKLTASAAQCQQNKVDKSL